MKISVITVAYNSERFISTCIQSVLNQSYNNIEYIIIDGASSDNTLNIIKKYDRITHWVSEPDRGIYDAINKGIRLATGDLIGILNSDDFFADDDVLNRIAAQFANNDLEAVYSDICFVTSDDLLKPTRYYSSKQFKPWMFRYGFQPAHPTFYVKREVFKKYGMYRIDWKISGDFELLMRLLLINKIKYKYVKDIWVKMRTGGISTSGLKSVFKVNNEILAACKANSIYTNKAMIYSKYFIKWWGFIFKK
ncbi:glycosyltransferase family 2 protein [Mucilaginibacter paludis]|uniref:Glycosyl transferase family 2 n=1 Tax=Mucilaginibacter paludis DSM 18603 TaxID=714943 RepID=H1YJ26_9SPHI|nr:glycosyltransferase [Mucilaginibacter paludis]EHQ27721.1 glycosyl transferase family 2 [Mucilaginibacter paludis DSM 18603]